MGLSGGQGLGFNGLKYEALGHNMRIEVTGKLGLQLGLQKT